MAFVPPPHPPPVPDIHSIVRTGARLWELSETGNWQIDIRTGRIYAGDVAAFLRQTRDYQPLLGYIVWEIVEKGKYGAIEAGFFHPITEEISRPSNP